MTGEQAGSHSVRAGAVAVEGAALRYRIEGTGIPVLVLGSATYYPRTFSRRLREHCRLAFADLRHFAEGGSAVEAGSLTFDTYADDIERVRAVVGFERAVLVGHSKHGNLALEYAKRYPDRASRVVMIGSPPFGVTRTVAARDGYWAAYADAGRKAALEQALRRLAAGRPRSESRAEALVARYVAEAPKYWYDPLYDASPMWREVYVDMAVTDRLHDLFSQYEVGWDPARMTAPVLVVAGRHDYVVPHVLWDEALPKLRNVSYRLFERSGHTPQLEEPELFDGVLLDWLRTEPARLTGLAADGS